VGNTTTTVNVDPVVKSIYDPSPVGFIVPCSGAFQGWNENGRLYWQNTIGKQGFYIYQLAPTTGNAILFPALGYRTGAISLNSIGSSCHYWTFGPASEAYAYYLDFYPNRLSPEHAEDRYYGLTIRCVTE
jgi:hypothetical protein